MQKPTLTVGGGREGKSEREEVGFTGRQQLSSHREVWLLKPQSQAGAPGHSDGSALSPGPLVQLTGLSFCLDPTLYGSSSMGLKRPIWSPPSANSLACPDLQPCLLPGLSPACWYPFPHSSPCAACGASAVLAAAPGTAGGSDPGSQALTLPAATCCCLVCLQLSAQS